LVRLPEAPKPVATYVLAARGGNLLFTAGHGPALPEGGYVQGKLGRDLTLEEGRRAARLTGISMLASVRSELGSLDRVVRLVKVLGMVNAAPDFTQHSQVLNGFSDLMVEVFAKEAGTAARSAVGMGSLPIGIACEIEAVFEVVDGCP